MCQVIEFPWGKKEFEKTFCAVEEVWREGDFICVKLSIHGDFELFIDGLIARVIGFNGKESKNEPLNFLFQKKIGDVSYFDIKKLDFKEDILKILLVRVDHYKELRSTKFPFFLKNK